MTDDGSQPRCERCSVLMREIPGGMGCPACGYVLAPAMPISIPPRFTGPSVLGG